MTPQRLLACCMVMAATGCNFHVVVPGSNFPDSGIVCSDAGLGAATVSGSDAFQVGAAYQHVAEVIDNDSGVVMDRSVFITLLGRATACGVAPEPGPQLALSLFDPSGSYGPGDYLAGSQQLAGACACVTGPDGGRGALVGLVDSSDGGNGARFASGGVVHVTAFGACSVSGSFDVRFSTPDGGDAGGLSGTFDPVYCAH